ETSHIPAADQPFKKLFVSLSTPSSKRSVSYSSFNNSRFVVAGEDDDRFFYVMYRNAGTESVGYSVNWTKAHDDEGTVIATFLASNFTPLNDVPLPAEEQKSAATATAVSSFGAFTLPADANVISLNGEISDNTAN